MGASILKGNYLNLFNAIGYTYGGSGNNFNIPDIRGRVAIGTGSGAGLITRNLGTTGGAETHLLTTDELPSHSHSSNAIGGTIGLITSTGSNTMNGILYIIYIYKYYIYKMNYFHQFRKNNHSSQSRKNIKGKSNCRRKSKSKNKSKRKPNNKKNSRKRVSSLDPQMKKMLREQFEEAVEILEVLNNKLKDSHNKKLKGGIKFFGKTWKRVMTILGISDEKQQHGQSFANNIANAAGGGVASSASPIAAVGDAEQQWLQIPIHERWATILAINYFLRTEHLLKGVGIVKDLVPVASILVDIFKGSDALTTAAAEAEAEAEAESVPITTYRIGRTLLLSMYGIGTKVHSDDIETHWKNNVGRVAAQLRGIEESELGLNTMFAAFPPEVLLQAHTILAQHGLNTVKGQLIAGLRTCTDHFILSFFGTTLFGDVGEGTEDFGDVSGEVFEFVMGLND